MKDISHEYKKVTEIKIPDTITHIGDYQFCCSNNITSIEIPNSVTWIGEGAFFGCSSITSIVIPNGITSIGYNAFYNCISLTSITISDSVISIGEGAFYNCSRLASISVDSNNPIYDSRDNCNAIIETATNTLVIGCKNTSIPNSVTSIGSYVFSGCRSLTSITIPDSVTSIGPAAFSECRSLTSITIPDSVTSIGNYAFWNCQYLYEITNHSDLVFELGSPSYGYIAYYAKRIIDKNGNRIENENSKLIITDDNFVFIYEKEKYILKSYIGNENEITLPTDINGCEYTINEFTSFTTTSIILPNSITCIGDFAFRGCSSLTSITIPNSITSIGYCAFYWDGSLINVYYDGTIEDWCNIKFYSLYGSDNSNPMVYAQHFYMKDINYEYKEVTEIKIPDTITSIGDYQFYGFNNITSINIPNSVTSIGKEAFACCSNLTSITIPNSITSIGFYAFDECSSLTNVYYDGTIEDWCKIQFKEYDSNPMYCAEKFYMKDANYEYKEVTEIKIPDTITSLGDYQFYGFNNIASIEISDSVKSLGRWTFADCSSLTSITIPKSMTSLGWAAFSQCNSITSIIVDENNPIYDSRDNCNAIIEKATNTLVLGCKNTSIPNNVTCIGDGAFFGCGSLTSIAIP